jgi:altronate dehydratase
VEEEEDTRVFKNIDVRFITHQGGCGGIRQDAEALGRLFAGYVNNPNVAGATVLSLGVRIFRCRFLWMRFTLWLPIIKTDCCLRTAKIGND